jgi:hypothetical protein
VTTLFSGAVYNSYQLQIYVQINDNDEAFTTYDIEQLISVMPNVSNLELIKEKLILADTSFIDNILLNEGDYLDSIQILQIISSLINDQSLSDKVGLILHENFTTAFPQIYGPFSNYTGATSVKKFFKIELCLTSGIIASMG